ncbi:hypothetical protein SAMN02745126_06301 [Enhydrobacter aerosaccus]|uniref:Beta-lactamase-related domain-containing protein n=1 Tax=Enhydrobacter aerosaccus TaxID=225324 RepID=A0A1T4TI81_9HYPH|nr:serine hydrolase [Enhydrobacter aerosaccus]SKA40018.1 hypothetical protein SAMN02745126_06301 [Enhydrobacter aerosaccus]
MKRTATAILISFLLPLMLGGCGVDRALHVASSLTAHELCSVAFVEGRDPEPVFHDYLQPFIGVRIVADRLHYTVDHERRQVTATVGHAFAARAVYAEGRGCTVMNRSAAPPAPLVLDPVAFADVPLPQAPDPRLTAAIDRAFTPDRRALVIVQDGNIVGERYAAGDRADTRLQSWSMAKSITNALIGILVRNGKLALDQPVPGLPNGITVDHLLRQTSGQPFGSSNSGFDLSSRMQFLEADTAAFAATRFEGKPGERWSYTDANYQLLSGIVRRAAGGTPDAVANFARRELFGPAGMKSALLEFDEAGTPMGASWAFASARDWARFGLLYLNDGVVEGRRLLPEGWVDYSARPTPPAEAGYGAGFWTNRGESEGARRRRSWGMPADSFFALGNSGQIVLIAPSRRLVIVSLGFSLDPTNHTPVEAVARLAQALADLGSAR